MEVDTGVAAEPSVMLGLVGTEVIEDDMNILPGVSSDDLVHKGQELFAPFSIGMHADDLAGRHLESGKQSSSPVSLVFMALAADGSAIRQP